MRNIVIPVPSEFNFDFCLQFLRRSQKEILHRVEGKRVIKLIQLGDERILFSIEPCDDGLTIGFPGPSPSKDGLDRLVAYVREWFDLETDLGKFYRIAKRDKLLGNLVKKFRGHRIISHPDLFESLIWAVLGQQINLAFAYTLKQRFVQSYGEKVEYDGRVYHLFPTPAKVSGLTELELLPLQFSRQKSSYTINIARAFVDGEISKEKLKGMTLTEAKDILMRIKGVGNWTANYALMRTFRYPDAFPLEDAGLHNAIKNLLGMKQNPTVKRVKTIFKNYKGYEAYATIYLWKSL